MTFYIIFLNFAEMWFPYHTLNLHKAAAHALWLQRRQPNTDMIWLTRQNTLEPQKWESRKQGISKPRNLHDDIISYTW